ncbi:hypothetical protein MKW92_005779 [Papaver armeniacum]|nr:hypothetical protein MKW92_005779 [Papaver armeniacum]
MTRFWCFPRVAPIDGESSDREDGTGTHEGVRANQAESQDVVAKANARVFELNELIVATKNFDPQLVLGEGKLGRVYKGKLGDSQVEMLSCSEHSNLVKLIGYHDKGDDLCSIYEFMPYVSLDLHLYGHEIGRKPLDWKTRMKIAKGVAKALQYLHDQKDPPVLFGDLKASSILLDENFNPKLFDFSFAKLVPTWDNSKASKMVIGTLGYCAIEYGLTCRLTKQYDIFSFGVVLLELITGRKAIQENLAAKLSMLFGHSHILVTTRSSKRLLTHPWKGAIQKMNLLKLLLLKRPPIADVVAKLPRVLSQADGEAWDEIEA